MAFAEIPGSWARTADWSRTGSASRPLDRAGAGVAEYDSRARVSTLRLLRAGALLVITYQLVFLNLDAHVAPNHGGILMYDLAGAMLGAIGFALTYSNWFAGLWRAVVLLIGSAELVTATMAAAYAGDPIRLFATVILYSLGSASLVPWSWYWQQSFNLAGIGALIAANPYFVEPSPYADERWLAVLVAAAIGQCTTVFAELHRRELRRTVERLDRSQEHLSREAEERGRAIADLERAKEELRESEQLFRSLVENAMDMVVVIRPDGLVTFNSPSVERLTGWIPSEVIDQSAFDSIHPDDVAEVAEGLRTALETSSSFQMARFRLRNKDGSWRVWEASGRGLPGDPPRVLVNARDVTERVQLEEQLTAARDAALEASRLKSAFLANVSHEVRTPLYIILGYSEYIAQRIGEAGDAAYQAEFDAIARAGKRLLATIQGILDLSRIEAHAFDLNPATIDLGSITERMIADLRVLAEAKGLELACVIEDAGAVVRFDEYCLSNALSNLLHNAIKFTDHGRVEARVYRDGDGRPCIDVRDTGAGIDPAYMPQLFEPFSQERGASSHRAEGAGLGLALTRQYLELNSAWLSVESRKGKGSTFTIHFGDCNAIAGAAENPFYATAART